MLFAGNSVFGKIALRHVSPMGVLGLRVPTGALLFLGLRALLARRFGWQRVERRDLPLLVGVALLGVTLNQLLFFEGLAHTTAMNATVLSTTIPVFTAGFSILLGRERLTTRSVIGLAIALGGALLVALLGRPAQAGRLHVELGLGELCLIGNSAAYALYLIASRPLFQRYRTETAITWIFAIGAVTLLPLGLRPLVHEVPAAPIAAQLSLLYIVLGPTVGAYFLNGYALTRSPPSLVAIYIYAQPVIAALLASALLDEHLVPATLFGAVLIGAGIALVSIVRPAPATYSARR